MEEILFAAREVWPGRSHTGRWHTPKFGVCCSLWALSIRAEILGRVFVFLNKRKRGTETSRGIAKVSLISSPQFWEQKLIMYIHPLRPISCGCVPGFVENVPGFVVLWKMSLQSSVRGDDSVPVGSRKSELAHFKLKTISLGTFLQSLTIGFLELLLFRTIFHCPRVFEIARFNCN